jgi:hypothetical protein
MEQGPCEANSCFDSQQIERKAIPLTGREGGGEVVSPMHLPHLPPGRFLVLISVRG